MRQGFRGFTDSLPFLLLFPKSSRQSGIIGKLVTGGVIR